MIDDVIATPSAPGERHDAAPGKKTPDNSTKLALSRTLLAFDRTLMAWVRTAMSLISFGFTIDKFFEYVRSDSSKPVTDSILTPRAVGLVMIGLGVGSLFFATLEYRAQVRVMRESYSEYGPFHRSLAVIIAALISVIGVLGFVFVLFRL